MVVAAELVAVLQISPLDALALSAHELTRDCVECVITLSGTNVALGGIV